MLLDIVTFSGDKSRNDVAGRESHSTALSLGRVWLFGFQDHDSDDDPLLEWISLQMRSLRNIGLDWHALLSTFYLIQGSISLLTLVDDR